MFSFLQIFLWYGGIAGRSVGTKSGNNVLFLHLLGRIGIMRALVSLGCMCYNGSLYLSRQNIINLEMRLPSEVEP
ncbi:hypothetical protein M501DRAFT_668889 [Patellaria atrata CBS 101060]|uniref:Uncharacterized protein n=1 Tax=Patellaria atrata CBS 101060 TaxID=1346257 RepID=A0A9P4SE75_9PEZI|nr:hypothetical protein M501DRAFT_668889 [Patellaria atrata CBS 101060]